MKRRNATNHPDNPCLYYFCTWKMLCVSDYYKHRKHTYRWVNPNWPGEWALSCARLPENTEKQVLLMRKYALHMRLWSIMDLLRCTACRLLLTLCNDILTKILVDILSSLLLYFPLSNELINLFWIHIAGLLQGGWEGERGERKIFCFGASALYLSVPILSSLLPNHFITCPLEELYIIHDLC